MGSEGVTVKTMNDPKPYEADEWNDLPNVGGTPDLRRVRATVEALEQARRERDEADAMLECQIDGIPPCHGPGKQDSGMCRACLLSRCRRVERERDALKAALRECVAFVEDDTCRHDYEKRAPLKRAREALGEVES